MKKITILFIFSFLFVQLASAATSVPPRFHFQSVFYDSGGNSLPTGTYLAKFSVLDQSYQAVYSEEQEVELVNGVASTMIGDGFEAGSNLTTPTGGIARNLVDPYQTYYLQAEIEGDTRILDIGSVPYAQYSEEALSVATGSITSESILEGIIQREHLSEALEEAIFGTVAGDRLPESIVSRDDFQNHVNTGSNAHPASAISVTGSFANANSTNVEGVLGDFDRAIELQSNNLDAAFNGLQSRIDRVNTDLQNRISSVNTDLQNQISSVNTSLQNQISSVNTGLQNQIDQVHADISADSSATESRLNDLQNSLNLRPFAFGRVGPPTNGCSLSASHNIAGAVRTWPDPDSWDCTITFSNSASGDYVVLVTRTGANGNSTNDVAPVMAYNFLNRSFNIRTGNSEQGATFVVFGNF